MQHVLGKRMEWTGAGVRQWDAIGTGSGQQVGEEGPSGVAIDSDGVMRVAATEC